MRKNLILKSKLGLRPWLVGFVTCLVVSSCSESKENAAPQPVPDSTVSPIAELVDDTYKWITTGQYVSKDVKVISNGEERLTRPKADITSISLPNGRVAATVFMSSAGRGLVGINPNITGHNPAYIYDLKIEKCNSCTPSPQTGYTSIPVDLNKGAGGTYIFLTFTRDPKYDVGPQVTGGYGYPITQITSKSSRLGGLQSWPNDFYPPMYEATGNPLAPWKVPDLNDGAGGRYIYGYQTKLTSSGGPITEVGVIAGSSSSIQPPAGWIKASGDLNENAGGDYIYFCTKK